MDVKIWAERLHIAEKRQQTPDSLLGGDGDPGKGEVDPFVEQMLRNELVAVGAFLASYYLRASAPSGVSLPERSNHN